MRTRPTPRAWRPSVEPTLGGGRDLVAFRLRLAVCSAYRHLVEVLQHLPFVGGHCVVRLDRGVRDYLMRALRKQPA
jgi:hypothetical protein